MATVKNDKDLEKENKDLKKQVTDQSKEMKEMKEMMEAFMKKVSEEKEEKKEESKKSEVLHDDYGDVPDISPSQRVKVVQMVYGGTTLKSGRTKTRFNERGQTRQIRFEDLETMRFDDSYSKLFEELMLYIVNEDVRKALSLEEYYDKCKVNPSTFKAMALGDKDAMIESLKAMPTDLQTSFATYFIDNANEGVVEFLDKNKWSALNSHFSIKIADMLEE